MKRYGVFLLLFIVWAVIAAGCGSDSASDEGYAGGMGSTSNQSAEPSNIKHSAKKRLWRTMRERQPMAQKRRYRTVRNA